MDLRLEGKRALVTGASKGIGLATAAILAAEGCVVTMVARNGDVLQRAAASLGKGNAVTVIEADLSRETARTDLVNAVGAVDILVNNAGAIPGGDLLGVSDEAWREAWELKVFGFISLCRHFYPLMRKQGSGVIVNILGAAGDRPDPGYIAGSTGNAGLMAFTKALGQESPRYGVRVVGINPGFTLTDRARVLLQSRAQRDLGDGERWMELVSGLPFGRACLPAEIANAAAFLASDASAYTSGSILAITGGA